MERPKPIFPYSMKDYNNSILGMPSDSINLEFDIIQDLSAKALLATDRQTFARQKIFSLTMRLMMKLKKDRTISKKSLTKMISQLLLKSRFVSDMFKN